MAGRSRRHTSWAEGASAARDMAMAAAISGSSSNGAITSSGGAAVVSCTLAAEPVKTISWCCLR